MSLFGSIKNFVGNLFGDDNDDKKKKQQSQQRQASSSRPQSSAPRPGTVILPTQQKNGQNKQNQPQKQPDNHISVGNQPDLPEVLKKATQKPVVPKKPADPAPQMSNAEIAARSVGSVGANLVGMGLGAAKGVAQLPSGILQVPKLVKIGVAKVTKNKVAEENAANTRGLWEKSAENWDSFVKPVTDPLTKAELATDDAALKISPWQPKVAKDVTKAAGNLIPVEAAVTGVNALSKASKAAKLEKADRTRAFMAGEIDDFAPPKKAEGLSSVNPNREADALKQGQTDAAALPPAPEMDPVIQQTIADGKAGDQAARMREAQQNSLASSVRPVTNPQGFAELPEGAIPVRQPLQRMPEPDEAYLARERQAQIDGPELETPAYLSRLNTPDRVNDHLRNASNDLAADPDFGPVIQEAFMQTGSKDPLSLTAQALASTNDKGRIRAMVERLVPGADGNALNRAVNSIVGADETPDVLDALHTAITRTNEERLVGGPAPFGPVSDAPALPPAGMEPVVVRTRPDGAQIMSDDSVRAADGTPLGRVNKLEEVEPTPDVAPVADNATPNVPSFDEAPTLKKAENVNASLAKAEPVNVSAPAKVEKVSSSDQAPVKAVAKTTEKPAKAVPKTPQKDLPDAKVSKAAESGETGKSQGKYSRGQEYEKASNAASHERGADKAANTSYDDFLKKVEDEGGMNGLSRDTAVELQRRFKPGSAEHRMLGDLINKYHTNAAQALATIDRVIRQTASADRLTDRFVSRLYKSTDDSIEFTAKDFDAVIKKNEEFVTARDDQNAAIEAFNKDPSEANANAVAEAFNKVDEADRAAKFQEYRTAVDLTKKSKNPTTKAYVKDLEQKAGVYTMDLPDSSLLSSSRVMINNFLNTLGVRAEERLFGSAGAKIARLLTKTTIGGGNRQGAKLGAKLGSKKWRSDAALRQGANENFLTKSIKNFTTTGNTIGDRNTYAAAYSGVFDHYKAKLKSEGYKGEELDRRAMVNSLADPDNVTFDYMNQALANNAMASISAGPQAAKIETFLTDKFADVLGGSKVANGAAKLVVRMTLGFPTVITRSLFQGAKRASLGFPSATHAVWNAVRGGPKEMTALYIKNAVKEAGSGATMYAVGFALGSEGIITGSYPKDQAERDRWKREGITENSIKLGNDYYSLPSALGVFSLPFMIGANSANHVQSGGKVTDNFVRDTISTIIDATPVDTMSSVLNIVNDWQQGKDVTDELARLASSATRAATPLGSLVNEVAKMFDPTANDTSKGDFLTQFLHKVQDGIPGVANKLPAKKVDGKEVKNPDPVAKFFGATSTEQSDGVKKTQQIKADDAKQTGTLKDTGIFTPKVRGILDDNTKEIFDKASKGEQITPEERKKLNSGITKNVTATEDTRYLEDGDYDTNLAVLKAKKSIMEQDPTTQKADIEKFDDQIKRGEVYKELKTPYDDIKKYRSIDLTEWRSLGDPASADYNPDLYEKLFDLDAALTDAGVSGKSSDKTKPKYYAKTSKSGSGSGRAGRSSAGSGASDELRKIQSNTLGDTVTLKKVDLSDLAPKKMDVAQIPKIQQIRSSDLIKKRKISVSRGV